MNDRFKFRFWDKEICQMRYGDVAIDNEGYPFVLTEQKKFTVIERLDNIIPLQSTGLKDKNGKLIYEGDIVKTSNYRCNLIVTWFKNKFILVPYSDYQDKDKYASERINGYRYFENNNRYADKRDEVIGNKFENPELLKECE